MRKFFENAFFFLFSAWNEYHIIVQHFPNLGPPTSLNWITNWQNRMNNYNMLFLIGNEKHFFARFVFTSK